jgi:hypothetical protein
MWSDVAEVAIDVLAPGGGGPDLDYDRLFDKKNQLRVPLAVPGAFKERLNASGWLDDEVIAAGIVTQGRAQSLFSMFTGWALVELARARRSKSLPREFCLAVTHDRAIALAMSAWSEGGGSETSGDVVVKVKREQAGSWARGSVRIEPDGRELRSGQRGGTLRLAGNEQLPVTWATGSDSEEVVELLAG